MSSFARTAIDNCPLFIYFCRLLAANLFGHALEAGLDEAGRGCLAGPVFAAAVILPADFNPPFLNDSKQLTAKRREALHPAICAAAVAWAVGQATVAEIEEAVCLAETAFDAYKILTAENRAIFLETIAEEIINLGNDLIIIAMQESGLPEGRLLGERGRTIGQLKLL